MRHAVGDMAARTHAAEAAVLRAAEAVVAAEVAPTRGADSDAGEQALLRTASLEVSNRHWRNARTVANHNPRAYKAAVVGGHLLAGEEPPTTGFF